MVVDVRGGRSAKSTLARQTDAGGSKAHAPYPISSPSGSRTRVTCDPAVSADLDLELEENDGVACNCARAGKRRAVGT
jgi:hypothetical protein